MLSELLQPFTIGLGAYPTVSVVIFFTVFVAAIWQMIRMDKTYLEEMSSMPLDADDAANADRED
ncbi:CcoQ/FixQ family Cbb3-type cytochrome c oxidase assembly chaperone [bacterium]|nr:CcoQ/FixQ family Cbb3-type cytochrome c oxidase assembly chaperone [bacterium]